MGEYIITQQPSTKVQLQVIAVSKKHNGKLHNAGIAIFNLAKAAICSYIHCGSKQC